MRWDRRSSISGPSYGRKRPSTGQRPFNRPRRLAQLTPAGGRCAPQWPRATPDRGRAGPLPELDSEAWRAGYPPLDALCVPARLVAHTFGCTPVCVATDGLVSAGFVRSSLVSLMQSPDPGLAVAE